MLYLLLQVFHPMSRCPMSNLSTSQSIRQALQVPRLGSLTTSTGAEGSLADAWVPFIQVGPAWKPWDLMVTVVVVFMRNHSNLKQGLRVCSKTSFDLSPRNFELIALTRVSTAIRSTTRCHDGLQKEDTWKNNMRDANGKPQEPGLIRFAVFHLLVSECFVAIFPQIAWMCFFQSNSQSPWYATSIY
jgi:hypothetical protein